MVNVIYTLLTDKIHIIDIVRKKENVSSALGKYLFGSLIHLGILS